MFKTGDRVTIDRLGEPAGREWTVVTTEPDGCWAVLSRRIEGSTVATTSVPVKRLRLATSAPVATSQPATSQITGKEFEARIAEHPIENLGVLNDALIDRIVRRARYDALRAFLRVLASSVEAAQENNRGLGYRDEDRPVGVTELAAAVIRDMVNETARELGVREPWAGAE